MLIPTQHMAAENSGDIWETQKIWVLVSLTKINEEDNEEVVNSLIYFFQLLFQFLFHFFSIRAFNLHQ